MNPLYYTLHYTSNKYMCIWCKKVSVNMTLFKLSLKMQFVVVERFTRTSLAIHLLCTLCVFVDILLYLFLYISVDHSWYTIIIYSILYIYYL